MLHLQYHYGNIYQYFFNINAVDNQYFKMMRFFVLSSKRAFLIAFCPSSVRLSVYKLYIFDFFSRTAGPILTKLSTNHHWEEGIQVCSNEEDCSSPRGDNSKRVKIHWKFLKIFFSRTSRPNSTKLGTHHPWEFKFLQIKGQVLFKGEIITKM